MKKKDKPPIYTQSKKGFASRLIKFLQRIMFGKYTFFYHDEQPTEPSMFIANHTYYVGPLIIQYQYPGNVRTWSNSKFFTKEDCLPYMKYKFSDNRKRGKKIVAFFLKLITKTVIWFYSKKLNAIPVYHDFNIGKTFRMSSESLVNGSNVAIYPEQVDAEFNGVVCKFATGFAYAAQTHYKITGECLKFYPIYIAQKLKQVHFGKPIQYDPDVPIKEQTVIITDYLEQSIISLHDMLPPHKVIPMFKEDKS